jgi:hypothetical protein
VIFPRASHGPAGRTVGGPEIALAINVPDGIGTTSGDDGARSLYRYRVADTATWLETVGTCVGALGTVGALIATYRLLRREADRDQVNATARQDAAVADARRQAEKVTAWYGTEYDAQEDAINDGVFIRNASELPVYDVHIAWTRAAAREQWAEEAWADARVLSINFAVLPPEGVPRFSYMTPLDGDYRFTELIRGMDKADIAVEIDFRDAAGRRWRRSAEGVLSEIGDVTEQRPRKWVTIPTARYASKITAA